MDLAGNHRKLIEETIRANDRYFGNEDLLEAFCSDVYKKSYLLLDSVSNVENLKTYLAKVVDTSISHILKQNGRDDTPRPRSEKSEVRIDILDTPDIKEKIVKETNIPKEDIERATVFAKQKRGVLPQSLKDERIVSLKTDGNVVKNLAGDIFADVDDPKLEFPENEIKENVINKILSIVFELHTQYPEKGYFQIFYLRHARLKKQANIANELKITQGELSKRYYELIKLVKERL